jgi:hypothetical protein
MNFVLPRGEFSFAQADGKEHREDPGDALALLFHAMVLTGHPQQVSHREAAASTTDNRNKRSSSVAQQ